MRSLEVPAPPIERPRWAQAGLVGQALIVVGSLSAFPIGLTGPGWSSLTTYYVYPSFVVVPLATLLWWQFGLGWATLLVDAYYGFSAVMFGNASAQYGEGHLPPPDLVFVPLQYVPGSSIGALGVLRGHHRP